MKTIAGWVLAAGLLMAVVFGLTPRHDSVPVDGVQVFDEPEVAAMPEVVAPLAASVVYSDVELWLDFGEKQHARRVAWATLHQPHKGSTAWTLGRTGATNEKPASDAGITVYAYEAPDGRLYVAAVLVTDEFKAANTLDDRLPLAPVLEPAMADVAATSRLKSAGVADAAAELAQLYAVESKRETRKRSKIVLPEVDERDVLFARQHYGR